MKTLLIVLIALAGCGLSVTESEMLLDATDDAGVAAPDAGGCVLAAESCCPIAGCEDAGGHVERLRGFDCCVGG